MEKSKNIYQRINSVMGEVKYARKQDKNAGLKYSYVSHDSVIGLLRDSVQTNGIVILPSIESYGLVNNMMMMQLKVSIINMDNPEDQIVMNYSVPSNSRNGVVDEKTFGSTYSYAFKYALLKTFMIETGEDADASSDEPKRKTETKPLNVLDEAQVDTIKMLGKSHPEHLKICLDSLKIAKVEYIPADLYERIVASFASKKSTENAA